MLPYEVLLCIEEGEDQRSFKTPMENLIPSQENNMAMPRILTLGQVQEQYTQCFPMNDFTQPLLPSILSNICTFIKFLLSWSQEFIDKHSFSSH